MRVGFAFMKKGNITILVGIDFSNYMGDSTELTFEEGFINRLAKIV